MLKGVGMSKPDGKTLTEDQVLLIAKAFRDRRRYEILKVSRRSPGCARLRRGA
jgi:hypothetical protein